MNKNRRVVLVFLSIALLLLGLIIYLYLAPKTIISSFVYSIIPFSCIEHNDSFFLRFLRNYGADFLWSAAFTMVIQLIIWLNKKNSIFLIFCFSLGVVFELLQAFGVSPGIADIFDVLAYFLGSVFSIIIIRGGKLYEEE